MYALQHTQTIVPHCNGALRLGGLISPYFQLTAARKRNPLRDIKITPSIMTLTAKIAGYTAAASSVNVQVFLESSDGTINVGTVLSLPTAYTDTDVTIEAAVATAINSLCASISLPNPSTIDWLFSTPGDVAAAIAATVPSGLSAAPQAAITDCPADATTNYNTVTTLLGAVTGAVNTANTKQNQIATQLNTLLAELRTLGLIHA